MCEILEEAVGDRLETIGDTAVCSAIQAVVGTVDGGIDFDEALGRTRLDGAGELVDGETRFDVASLTKPMVTATLAMQAVEAGRIAWDAPIGRYLALGESEVAEATVLQLLNHTSGLPDWTPLYESSDYPSFSSRTAEPFSAEIDPDVIIRRLACEHVGDIDLEAPPGERETYSDLGYVLLAAMLERVEGGTLDRLAEARIFEPLGMERTGFVPLGSDEAPLENAVATEDDPERGGVIEGTVHDRNTEALGGVSGQAGVFSTARDVWRFGCHLAAIDRGTLDGEPVVDREILRFCWSDEARAGVGHHVGGWDTPSGEPSSAGRGFQAGETVGHLGFTGTSIWIERERGLIAVLLTNRVYPSRDNDRIDDLRLEFHEAVLPP